MAWNVAVEGVVGMIPFAGDVFDAAWKANQRNLRLLGIFARLVTRDAKPRYAAFMPRLWDYLDRCLSEPDLAPLNAWLDRHVPAEART